MWFECVSLWGVFIPPHWGPQLCLEPLAELTKECPSDQRKSPSMVLSFRPIHW